MTNADSGYLPALTIREWYAALAMSAYIASHTDDVRSPDPDDAAERAVKYADALLAELAKGGDQ